MANHRQERINEDAKRAISEIVRELKDPRIPIMSTVTAVQITPDLKFAKVYVSILDTQEVQQKAIKALTSASGYVRRELARKIDLRNTPQINFVLDSSIEHGTHIAQLINKVCKDSED